MGLWDEIKSAGQWGIDKNDQFNGWMAEQAKPLTDAVGLTKTKAQQAAGTPYSFDPNAGQIQTQQSDADRANQSALVQALQLQASGKGPSLAQGQLQQATDANQKNAMALGAAQQGQGLGSQSALMNIGRATSDAQQQAAGQSAMIRNMEQMQAQQQLAGLLGGMRGQDMTGAGQQASNNMGMQGMMSQDTLAHQQLASGIDSQQQGNTVNMLKSGGQAAADFAKSLGSGSAGMAAMAHGGPVDSTRNDTVPAMLSPGEIVLPRSVALAGDAPDKAAAFVEAIRKAKGYADGGPVQVAPSRPWDPNDWTLATGKESGVLLDPATQPAPMPTEGGRDALPGFLSAASRPPVDMATPDVLGGSQMTVQERSDAAKRDLASKASRGAPPTSAPLEQPAPRPGVAVAPQSSGGAQYGTSGEMRDLKKGYADEAAAKGREAEAKVSADNAQADVIHNQGRIARNMQATNAAADAAEAGATQKTMDDYGNSIKAVADMKTDPHRFWASRSTGDKILAGIGMALGAVGGIGNGGVNSAVSVINDAISKDIAAQESDKESAKAGLAGKQTMVGMMRQQHGDNAASRAAAVAAAYEIAGNQLKETALRFGGPQQQAAAQAVQAQLSAEAAKQVGAMKMQANENGLRAAAQADNHLKTMAEVGKLNADAVGGGPSKELFVPGLGYALDKESAKAMRPAAASQASMDSAFNDLMALRKQHSDGGYSSTFEPTDTAKAKATMGKLIFAAKTAESAGALDKGLVDLLTDTIGDPTAYGYGADARLAKAQELYRSAFRDKAKVYMDPSASHLPSAGVKYGTNG